MDGECANMHAHMDLFHGTTSTVACAFHMDSTYTGTLDPDLYA